MPMLGTVTLEMKSGIPEDRVVNTFALMGTPGTSDEDEIADALASFYNAGASTAESVHAFLSDSLQFTGDVHTVRLYDIGAALDGSPHGSPYFLKSFTIPDSASGTPLPSEVAVVCTLRAGDPADWAVELGDNTRPRQRHTGRFYVGPLGSGAIEIVDSKPRVFSNLRAAIGFRAQDMHVRLVAASSGLGVWSRSNEVVYGATRVEVDNAFDTQRRRGVDPSLRETFTLVG